MNAITLIVVVVSAILLNSCLAQSEDELADFEFNDEDHTEPSTFNDIDYDESNDTATASAAATKEEFVKELIMNSMKSNEMKNKMAKVLPILRVMTPQQKLALASLVTTQVLAPPESQGLTLDEVNGLFGNNPNTTEELMLPISLDVANLFRRSRSDKGPVAEELRAPYRFPTILYRRNTIDRAQNKFYRPRKPGKQPPQAKESPNCDLFTNSICLKSHDYPIDQIMASIRRNKQAMAALLTDYKGMTIDGSIDGITPDQENRFSIDDISNEVRRTGAETGFMCPSQVRYARPQKARATNGQWKFIVNTPEHTQTLRLEKCLKPGDSCTFLTDNFKSRCVQVYNYHRLLTWDDINGLHMEIFKVPTCCSCHIDTYKVAYPPHHPTHATTDENFPGEEYDNEYAYSSSVESEQHIPNVLAPKYPNRQPAEVPEIYQLESSPKRRPSFNNHPTKFAETPKITRPIIKTITTQPFKRSNTPKPFNTKRPQRPLRRRIPNKPVRDLVQSESNFRQNVIPVSTTESYQTITVPTTKDSSRRINYNYHPIIDFFEPDKIESRMDVAYGDSDWKPVTSINQATESHFRK